LTPNQRKSLMKGKKKSKKRGAQTGNGKTCTDQKRSGQCQNLKENPGERGKREKSVVKKCFSEETKTKLTLGEPRVLGRQE